MSIVFRCYSGAVEREEGVDKRDQECEGSHTENLQ